MLKERREWKFVSDPGKRKNKQSSVQSHGKSSRVAVATVATVAQKYLFCLGFATNLLNNIRFVMVFGTNLYFSN